MSSERQHRIKLNHAPIKHSPLPKGSQRSEARQPSRQASAIQDVVCHTLAGKDLLSSATIQLYLRMECFGGEGWGVGREGEATGGYLN